MSLFTEDCSVGLIQSSLRSSQVYMHIYTMFTYTTGHECIKHNNKNCHQWSQAFHSKYLNCWTACMFNAIRHGIPDFRTGIASFRRVKYWVWGHIEGYHVLILTHEYEFHSCSETAQRGK